VLRLLLIGNQRIEIQVVALLTSSCTATDGEVLSRNTRLRLNGRKFFPAHACSPANLVGKAAPFRMNQRNLPRPWLIR
jgi:hypothetical protein